MIASGELPTFMFCENDDYLAQLRKDYSARIWGALGAILKPLLGVLGSLGAVWVALGAVLGWSWELLGRTWGGLGSSWGRSWGLSGRSCGSMLQQLKC